MLLAWLFAHANEKPYVLALRERVREKKKKNVEAAEIYGRDEPESSIHEIVKKGNKILCVLLLHLKLQ